MRWFFLAFFVVLAGLGNAAIFESFTFTRLNAGVAFNVFVLSLFVIWWGAYFSPTSRRRNFVIGHALLMFAAGLALTGLGVNAFLTDSCQDFIPNGHKSSSLRSQFGSYILSIGYCSELGFGIALLGLLLSYPSVLLFARITRRSSRPPSASADL